MRKVKIKKVISNQDIMNLLRAIPQDLPSRLRNHTITGSEIFIEITEFQGESAPSVFVEDNYWYCQEDGRWITCEEDATCFELSSYLFTIEHLDGERSYYCKYIVQLSEENYTEAMKQVIGEDVLYNDLYRAYEICGDHVLARPYHLRLIDSKEELHTLKKYGLF